MKKLDVNGNPVIEMGQILTCCETGKQFAAACDGFTYNYARDREGNLYSDEGVDIREKREMLDRSKPFCCYLSSDGRTVGGWKGNILGRVTQSSESRTGWRGSRLTHVRVIDVHGNPWHGKGAGSGMCIRLHPSKA
jgi:hypothetical protein